MGAWGKLGRAVGGGCCRYLAASQLQSQDRAVEHVAGMGAWGKLGRAPGGGCRRYLAASQLQIHDSVLITLINTVA
eukprot:COSAG02_NODE_5917_length_3941_cov_2.165279_4_plen_76_part_00